MQSRQLFLCGVEILRESTLSAAAESIPLIASDTR